MRIYDLYLLFFLAIPFFASITSLESDFEGLTIEDYSIDSIIMMRDELSMKCAHQFLFILA